VVLLLSLGSDVKATMFNGDSLMHAAVSLLCRNHVTVLANTSPDFFGRRALAVSPSWSRALAANAENISMVYTLLDWGVDFEQKDGDGNTPLSTAVRQGHWGVVAMLLSAGATVPQNNQALEKWMNENSIDPSCCLKHLCKPVIRQMLAPGIDSKIPALPLPQQLLVFLSLINFK
jgi:ankyrin repeat protein